MMAGLRVVQCRLVVVLTQIVFSESAWSTGTVTLRVNAALQLTLE